MLIAVVLEFTRPMNSSMDLGGRPAASIKVGFWMKIAIVLLVL